MRPDAVGSDGTRIVATQTSASLGERKGGNGDSVDLPGSCHGQVSDSNEPAGHKMPGEDVSHEATVTTRAYSGRLGRAAPTQYVLDWTEPGAPTPARYPTQRHLLGKWRRGPPSEDEPPHPPQRVELDRVNHWAGHAAALAQEEPAGQVITRMWREANDLLSLNWPRHT